MYKLYNPVTKKIVISRDVVFDEDRIYSWSSNGVGQTIPSNFEGENEEETQQPHQQQVPAISIIEDPQNEVSTATATSPIAVEHNEQDGAIAGSHPKRVRQRQAWMQDYDVT